MAAIPSSGTSWDQSLPHCDKQGVAPKDVPGCLPTMSCPWGSLWGLLPSCTCTNSMSPIHRVIPAERSPAGSRAARAHHHEKRCPRAQG